MTVSHTLTETTTFTRTHARHLAAKVVTDLKRIQRLHGEPSDDRIDAFEEEVIELLKGGFLGTVTYGFRRNGRWIEPTLRYTARDLADGSADDDDPGRVPRRAQTSGAPFHSYLTYSPAWFLLTQAQRRDFESRLPFQRTAAPEPGDDGYWTGDRTYSAGGRALDRSTLRSYR